MKPRTVGVQLLVSAVLMTGFSLMAGAETQFPKPGKINAGEQTIKEFSTFYAAIEEALRAEDIARMMQFYAEDYLHHGITKKQLKFMWLEIFSEFDDLYSVHIFTKIDDHGADAILVCTGGLFGIAEGSKDYQTVDRWISENHWLTRVDDEWKMIGGATHETPGRTGGRYELHPLF